VSVADIAERQCLKDWVVRLVTAGCFGILAMALAADMGCIVQQEVTRVALLRLIADFCILWFYTMISCLALGRRSPVAKASGFLPRAEALLGTFLLFALPVVAPRHDTVLANTVSSSLLLVGDGFALFGLLHLGRSFSLMAEARRLVTDGPYRLVRHPLYVGESFAMFGLFVQFACWQAALLLALQMFFQLRRMLNEEAVLRSVYPEYSAYMERTARVIPGIW
jgi:protein-S-isoprenylcysteine O-methyltransferase Ste14